MQGYEDCIAGQSSFTELSTIVDNIVNNIVASAYDVLIQIVQLVQQMMPNKNILLQELLLETIHRQYK
jgi:hypothetical protein